MIKSRQRLPWIVFVSTISGTAAAQTAPAPQPAPLPATAAPTAAQPAPAAQPAAQPAPVLAAQPLPESPQASFAPTAPAEPPLPPARPVHESNVGHLMGGMAWNVGVPVGSVRNFTSNASAAGLELLIKYWVHPRITIGASVDWQTYAEQRPRTTYQRPNGAITATAYNSVLMGTVRAGGDYFFLDEGPVLPFAGASIGFGWSTLQTAAADLAIYDNQSSVVLGLDAGVVISTSSRRGPMFLLGARSSAEPVVSFLDTVKDLQAITFQLGVMGR